MVAIHDKQFMSFFSQSSIGNLQRMKTSPNPQSSIHLLGPEKRLRGEICGPCSNEITLNGHAATGSSFLWQAEGRSGARYMRISGHRMTVMLAPRSCMTNCHGWKERGGWDNRWNSLWGTGIGN